MRLSLASARGNRHFLEQGIALLERIPASTYRTPVRPGWAPVGSQFRHVLDHYLAFLDGWETGQVDYDARQRNPLVEQEPGAALLQARDLLERLERIHSENANRTVAVQMDTGGGQQVPDWRLSTVGRELQFLLSHTVHHYALIKLLLEDVGFAADPRFGVAPSSLAHQSRVTRERAASGREGTGASSRTFVEQ